MIQGGDPDSKGAPAGKMLGVGGPDYTLEAEIKDGLFHKRGALAAARQGDEVNPERRSRGSQFYIVWGQVYNEGQLRQFSKQLKMQKVQDRATEEYDLETLISPLNRYANIIRTEHGQKICIRCSHHATYTDWIQQWQPAN